MEFIRPGNLKEALRVIADRHDSVVFIAGGTNVIPAMRAKILKPDALMDLGNLGELSYIREDRSTVRIGALTTIAELKASKIIQKYAPILHQSTITFGNPLVGNRATIGGNLSDASPAADTAVPLLTLDARVITEKEADGGREIPLHEFFLGPHRTRLTGGEILKEIRFEKPSAESRMSYLKLGLRNAMAVSVVSIALRVRLEGGSCTEAKVGMGAVAPCPLRLHRVERLMTGSPLGEDTLKACLATMAEEIAPISDLRASAEYRRWMASVLFERLLSDMMSRER